MRTLVKHALASTDAKESLIIKGWVRTRRDSKGFSFVEINDGSCLGNLQVVVDVGTPVALFTTALAGIPQDDSGRQYMVSRDGQRFLMDTLTEVTLPITVVLNWKPKP